MTKTTSRVLLLGLLVLAACGGGAPGGDGGYVRQCPTVSGAVGDYPRLKASYSGSFLAHMTALQAEGATSCAVMSGDLRAQLGAWNGLFYIEQYDPPDMEYQETYFYRPLHGSIGAAIRDTAQLVSIFVIDRTHLIAPCEVIWYGVDFSASWRGATANGAVLSLQMCVPYYNQSGKNVPAPEVTQ